MARILVIALCVVGYVALSVAGLLWAQRMGIVVQVPVYVDRCG